MFKVLSQTLKANQNWHRSVIICTQKRRNETKNQKLSHWKWYESRACVCSLYFVAGANVWIVQFSKLFYRIINISFFKHDQRTHSTLVSTKMMHGIAPHQVVCSLVMHTHVRNHASAHSSCTYCTNQVVHTWTFCTQWKLHSSETMSFWLVDEKNKNENDKISLNVNRWTRDKWQFSNAL